MTISIRIEKEVEDEVRLSLKKQGKTLSQYVREAILEKLGREKQDVSPYQLGKDLFGCHKSGRTELSSGRRDILKEKLRAKHRH